MSAMDVMMVDESESFVDSRVEDHPDLQLQALNLFDIAPQLPAYILTKDPEPYASLSDAVVDAEAQLLAGEVTYREDIQRMYDSFAAWDPPKPVPSSSSASGSHASTPELTGSDSEEEAMAVDTHPRRLTFKSTGSDSEDSDSDSDGDDEPEELKLKPKDKVKENWQTHGVDWKHPPRWGNHTIPIMDVLDIHEYIDAVLIGGKANYPVTCKVPGCTSHVVMKDRGALKRHLWARRHLNVRGNCGRCGQHSQRLDNFNSRHICKQR